jgi:hypothetical protein
MKGVCTMRITMVSLLALACLWVSSPAFAAHPPVTVQLLAQNKSGENGTATLSDLNGKTRVVIHLMGESATGNQPAHIHPGTCAKLNPVPKYPLNNVVSGASTTVVNASIAKLLSGHYAINVHESVQQIQTYVSCGNIP